MIKVRKISVILYQSLIKSDIVIVWNKENETVEGNTDSGGVTSEIKIDNDEESYNDNVILRNIDSAAEDLSDYQLARDMVRRPILAPAKLNDYTQFSFALLAYEVIDIEEPQCYHDALKDKNWEKWNGAMQEDMDSLIKNGTWVLVDKSEDHKVIG